MLSTLSREPSGLGLAHRLKFLLRDSVLYGGAAAVNKAFALITFPLLARYFSVADYGVIDYFAALAQLLTIFVIFGQDSAVARFFYEYKEKADRCQLISQSLVLQLGVTLIALPAVWLAAEGLVERFGPGRGSEWLLRLVLLQVPFLVLLNFSQNLLKWTFARSSFLFLTLGAAAANLVCLLVAVLVLQVGIHGIFIAFLLVQGGFGLLGLVLIRRWLVVPRGLTFLKDLIPFAVPLGVICCVAAFVPALERTLVGSLLGGHELGLYAAGTKVAMLVGVVASAFQTAWAPFSLAIHKEEDAANTFNWVARGFVLMICAAVLFLSAVAEPLLNVLATDRYAGAAVVVFPIAMGLAIQATSWITEIGITLSRKSYLGLFSYLAFVAGTFLAIQLLVNPFGLAGVAVGVLIGHILKGSIASWLAQRVYRLPWDFSALVAVLAVTVVVGLLGTLASGAVSPLAGSALFALGALAVSWAGWFGLFSVKERQRIFRLVRPGLDFSHAPTSKP